MDRNRQRRRSRAPDAGGHRARISNRDTGRSARHRRPQLLLSPTAQRGGGRHCESRAAPHYHRAPAGSDSPRECRPTRRVAQRRRSHAPRSAHFANAFRSAVQTAGSRYQADGAVTGASLMRRRWLPIRRRCPDRRGRQRPAMCSKSPRCRRRRSARSARPRP